MRPGVCALAFVLDGILAASRPGVALDRALLSGLALPRYTFLWQTSFSVNSDLPIWLTAATLLAGRIVWARWGARRALLVVACPALSALLADAVKDVGLVHAAPRLLASSAAATWPSGHTAGMAGLLGALALLPGRPALRRRLAAAGAILLVLGCLAQFATRSHRPTDVVGGVLLAAALVTALHRSPVLCESRFTPRRGDRVRGPERHARAGEVSRAGEDLAR